MDIITFAELVKAVKNLLSEDIDELSEMEILRCKKEEEIFNAVEEARKESKKGKTIVLSLSGKIKNFFRKMITDAN